MDIPSEKYTSDRSQKSPLIAVFRTIGNLVRRLKGFFVLSEEDRSKAGIFLGGEGRD
jgi:hypothetical protein